MASNPSYKLEDVDKLTIGQALVWIQNLGIEVDRNLTLERAKLMIRDYLLEGRPQRATRPPQWADQDTTSAAMKEDLNQRRRLKGMYDSSFRYIENLPDIFRMDLNNVFPHHSQQLLNMSGELSSSQCLILVAGEMGSGKSSLVNLLLGKDLLPTNELRCTAAVVEIHYGSHPRAVISWKDDSFGRAKEEIELKCKSNSDLQTFLDELETYIVKRDDDTDESPYEKIRLYWPIEMLKGGVVVVDSPGVGDSHNLSQQLAYYLERAFGFVYVLDSTCAIHKHRLGQLLLKAMETNDGFDPSTTMFILNRWDHVPAADHERVKQAIADRLTMILPEVQKSQLLPISVKMCREQVEYGQVLPDHKTLVESLRRFLPQAMRGKLRRYYRFLSPVLKRSLVTLRMSYNLNRKKFEDIKSESETVEQRLKLLQRDAQTCLDEMRREVKRTTFDAGTSVLDHLASMKAQTRLFTWHERDCPRREKSWQNVLKNASALIAERIAYEIDEWERMNAPIDKLHQDILHHFQKKFELFEKQFQEIKKIMFDASDDYAASSFHQAMRENLSSKKGTKLPKGSKGGPAILSMGSAVTCGLNLDPKSGELKNLFKEKYSNDPQAVMGKATHTLLSNMNVPMVVPTLTKFFDRYVKGIDKVAEFLPQLIKADELHLQQLSKDMRNGEKKLEVFPQLSRTAANLTGELDLFYVTKLMITDFTVDRLAYGEVMGRGSFANVYKGTIKDQGTVVAIKEPKDPITINDVTDCLTEESMLRDIEHDNIIKYYGVCRKGPDRDLRLIMVMEYCPYTLKDRCIDSSRAPSNFGRDKVRQDEAVLEVLNFLIQICKGLRFLHSKGIVHRDLKPENVLLTSKAEARIADFGLAKRVRDIVTLGIGTPVYMAPEILLHFEKYDTKADLYSLAMIMWELWYGRDLAEYASTNLQGGLKTNIREGWRPSCSFTAVPHDFWMALMESCWSENPRNRPSTEAVYKELAKQYKEIGRRQ